MGLTHCTAGNMRELPCRGTLDVCTWQNSPCDPGDDVWTRGVGVRGQCNIRSANRTSTTMVTVVTG